ncbi:MAG: 2Fe-2S iron-sulfur cluster binding domain-containing protein [Myxococcales bacterium]|nr:2Fe-2S iron-sulfur cluster binding domain-containing protein [Myxococcales bacterium]
MTITARIEPFGETLELEPGESVLSAILRHGKFVRYGCKHGGCGTCRARLIEGECTLDDRTSFSLSDSDRAEDIVLLCSAYVDEGEATFDVSKLQDLTEEEFHAGLQIDEYEAEVEQIIEHTHDIRTVRMRLQEPADMRFGAGQYVEVEVPGGNDEWRAYSMSNPPHEKGVIEIIVKVIPGGRFSSRLASDIRAGSRLRLRGPLGQFAVRLSHRPMIMVAGGSGMGPIRAMIHDLAATENQRPVIFFFGARTDRDLFLVDEFRAIEAAHSWFEFVPVLSEAERSENWTGEIGLVTEAVARRFEGFRGYEGYLCGPPGMIDAGIELLVGAGCKSRHVFFDRFVPSG